MTAAGRTESVILPSGPTTAKTSRQPHLLHIFPSYQMGGVPIRITKVLNHLGYRYRHTIVALDGGFGCKRRLEPGLDVNFSEVATSDYNLLRTITAVYARLREIGPDLLLTYNWGAVEWALANLLFSVCPHLHFESGFGPEEADGQIRRRTLMRRIALTRTRRVIVPSQTLVDIARTVWRLDPQKVLYVPNGVDCDLFCAQPEPGIIPGFAKDPEELIVGTVAPIRAEKNLARLVRAFAAVTGEFNARLLIVGDGVERPTLAALAGELGIADKVILPGHIDAVEKSLGWFDVFAMSSDTEQMPNSLLQAMAAGLPVAATDVGDIKHVLASENGPYVVSKHDDGLLTDALRRLLADPEARARLGDCNQHHVRATYSQDRMFDEYEKLYQSSLAPTLRDRHAASA